ncbi:sugar ABC transporter ATP-binding protein [Agrobacterium tumefaciens]|uniref:sugar ABC transporter ATP-binding protein n=1 Tax=Agrobacterium tumefaciens TaxID=358 RepID=UPI001572CD29|nr:sugar ABC transporter ATP-binding protein [Agrobacterium tumefaciens]NTB94904.1 sugar ABC transporter ATP-binding protein [Agrobacterium tumefaciens]NTC44025.1 sugar ABC transporter ATP-binding protein [Agrobacterium tumefaciens]
MVEVVHPPALTLRGVSKEFGPIKALRSIDLNLERHGVLGLVGENGAGKSTLISVINGTARPTTGDIEINGHKHVLGNPHVAAEAGIATVFQEQGLIHNLRVYQNIFLGREEKFARAGFLNAKAMVRLADDLLNDLGVEVDATAITGELNFGQRQLVEIAKAFALGRLYPVDPIILLDEPTSALSDFETQILFNSIRRWRGKASFILVSHRLSDVFEVCDHVAALKDGAINGQWKTNEVTADRLHEAIVGRQRTAEYYKESMQREELGDVVLEVEEISVPSRIEGASLSVKAGEILGIAGVLGSGKATLGHVLTGEIKQSRGTVTVNGTPLRPGSRLSALKADVGSVPGERNVAGVIGMHSVEWNLTMPSLRTFLYRKTPFLSAGKQAETTHRWIKHLKVKTPNRTTQIRNLSGGNAQKVVFAKWLARGVKVFVLDDPCRGLDVGAKEEIYVLLRQLANEGVAIVLISDNLPEIIGLSNRILTLRGGKISAEILAPSHDKPEEKLVVSTMV